MNREIIGLKEVTGGDLAEENLPLFSHNSKRDENTVIKMSPTELRE